MLSLLLATYIMSTGAFTFTELRATHPLNLGRPLDIEQRHILCDPQVPERRDGMFIYRNLRCLLFSTDPAA